MNKKVCFINTYSLNVVNERIKSGYYRTFRFKSRAVHIIVCNVITSTYLNVITPFQQSGTQQNDNNIIIVMCVTG